MQSSWSKGKRGEEKKRNKNTGSVSAFNPCYFTCIQNEVIIKFPSLRNEIIVLVYFSLG